MDYEKLYFELYSQVEDLLAGLIKIQQQAETRYLQELERDDEGSPAEPES